MSKEHVQNSLLFGLGSVKEGLRGYQADYFKSCASTYSATPTQF
jgi:hypothetical protein